MSRVSSIKEKYSLPEVAKNSGVEFSQSGSGYLGLCPFHEDSHPSFSIFPMKGDWYFKCHSGSCGVAGDIIDFVGLLEFGKSWDAKNTSMFKKAMSLLEKETPNHVSTPKNTHHEVTHNVVYLWKMALYFYKKELAKSVEAKNYLKRRGLPEDIIKKWHFGYCPQYGSEFLSLAGLSRKEEVYAGVVRQGKNKYYEFFYDRVVFADVDAKGDPLYLYGRTLNSVNNNKYLGVPNFQKPIFGIELPFRTDTVLLMEGAINAMIAQYWGYDAIALSGTSLSPKHTKTLRTKLDGRDLRPLPDNDKAGMKALSKWQSLMNWVGDPVFISPEHKDLNDFFLRDKDAKDKFSELV